jgi:hypothetical protein
MKPHTVLAAAVLLALAVSAVAHASQDAPAIHFTAHGASISGATPNGRVALIGIGIQPGTYFAKSFRWTGVVECDRSGAGTIDFGFPVPQATIWGVADATTARATLVTPGGVPVPIARARGAAFRRRGTAVAEFAFDHPVLHLLYVAPGGEIWSGEVSDGSKDDRDGPNGVSVLAIDDLQPLGAANGKAQEFKPGGCLIAIDDVRMEAISLRLDTAMLGAAQ